MKAYSQSSLRNRLYVGRGEKYVLSEKPVFKNNNGAVVDRGRELNSLFIWQKDRVIRIVFACEKKIANRNKINLSQIASLDNIVPAFKKVRQYYDLHNDDKGHAQLIAVKSFYSAWNYAGGSYDFQHQFKENINAWNKRHNPLADRFDWINVSDGDPNLFEKDPHRREKYVNNLPLVFDSPEHDSLYFIKPYYISIYHQLPDGGAVTGDYYQLYSSVSLVDEADAGFDLESFIEERTLEGLSKAHISYGPDAAIKFMAKYGLPKQKQYTTFVNHMFAGGEPELIVPDTTTDVRLSAEENQRRLKLRKQIRYSDSLQKIKKYREDSLKRVYEADCYGHYEFCKECYNAEISKAERLKRGCAVNIAPAAARESIWSYSFSANGINYFKVEGSHNDIKVDADRQSPMFGADKGIEVNENSYPMVWQLASPGIGYWLSDVNTGSRQVTLPDVNDFKLNGKPIK